MTIGYLEIYIGDQLSYDQQLQQYQKSSQFYDQVSARFGLQDTNLESLDQEQRELLESSSPPFPLSFTPPAPLHRGRLYLSISEVSGLAKTRENFVNLLTGSKGSCKADKSKKLHYKDCLLFRIEKDFVIQTGDITRNDGSGGEASIGSGVMKAETHGLGINPKFASLCMANSGRKDSITSQFFIVITDSEPQLKKLSGRKYVNFGNVICKENVEVDISDVKGKEIQVENWKEEGSKVLKELIELGFENGNPLKKAWISDCGTL